MWQKKIKTAGIVGSANESSSNWTLLPFKVACLVPRSDRWCETLYELQTKALIITLQIWLTSGGRQVPEYHWIRTVKKKIDKMILR